jgi:hypothetical protein
MSTLSRTYELYMIAYFVAIGTATVLLPFLITSANAQTVIDRIEIPTYDNTTHQLNGSKIVDAWPYRMLAEMSDNLKSIDEIMIPNGFVYNIPTQKYVPLYATIYATEYVTCVKQLHDSITYQSHEPISKRALGDPWQITIQNATLKDCVFHNSNWISARLSHRPF